MPTINSNQIFNLSQAEGGKFVKLDASDVPALSSFPQGVYALLTIPISEVGGNGSAAENTAYQDTPFSGQLSSVSNVSPDQLTNISSKGWMTISVDSDASDVVYVGDASVNINSGYKLSTTNPSINVTSDNLSKWYVIGNSGGEKIFILGAYNS